MRKTERTSCCLQEHTRETPQRSTHCTIFSFSIVVWTRFRFWNINARPHIFFDLSSSPGSASKKRGPSYLWCRWSGRVSFTLPSPECRAWKLMPWCILLKVSLWTDFITRWKHNLQLLLFRDTSIHNSHTVYWSLLSENHWTKTWTHKLKHNCQVVASIWFVSNSICLAVYIFWWLFLWLIMNIIFSIVPLRLLLLHWLH